MLQLTWLASVHSLNAALLLLSLTMPAFSRLATTSSQHSARGSRRQRLYFLMVCRQAVHTSHGNIHSSNPSLASLTTTRQCVGGTPICYRATIAGGQGFPSLAPHHDKLFACVTPLLHTTASFETITHGNSAVTQTRVSTFTSLSTSYASPTGVWTDYSRNTHTTTKTTASSSKQQTTGGPTTSGKTTTGKTSTGVTETTFKGLVAGTPACTCTGE